MTEICENCGKEIKGKIFASFMPECLLDAPVEVQNDMTRYYCSPTCWLCSGNGSREDDNKIYEKYILNNEKWND